MPKREATLKSAAMATIRARLPGFQFFQFSTAGAPDRLIVGNSLSTYFEFKHATPDFDDDPLQLHTCERLAENGAHCRYVIWWESATGLGQKTMIVHPRMVRERKGWLLVPEEVTPGFDHRWLAEYVRGVHRC